MPRPDLPPILLSEVRAAGLSLEVTCGHPDCRHRAVIDAGALALLGTLDLNAVGHRMSCTRCGRRRGNDVRPNARGWVRHLRATGQTERLPFFAAMMPETDEGPDQR